MKVKLFVFSAICLMLCSCSKEKEPVPDTYTKLFSVTDTFVNYLDKSSTNSYDAFGKKAKETSDGVFLVTPVGRMIAVKIKKTSQADYQITLTYLKERYNDTKCVNDIYKNNGGTITIDCRR